MKHETPSEEVFQQMKNIASVIWHSKNAHSTYLKEKMDMINKRVNYSDNTMVFYREFDSENQRLFLSLSSNEVKNYIHQNP